MKTTKQSVNPQALIVVPQLTVGIHAENEHFGRRHVGYDTGMIRSSRNAEYDGVQHDQLRAGLPLRHSTYAE